MRFKLSVNVSYAFSFLYVEIEIYDLCNRLDMYLIPRYGVWSKRSEDGPTLDSTD